MLEDSDSSVTTNDQGEQPNQDSSQLDHGSQPSPNNQSEQPRKHTFYAALGRILRRNSTVDPVDAQAEQVAARSNEMSDNYRKAPDYPARFALAEEKKTKARSEGEFWRVGFGDFRPLAWDIYEPDQDRPQDMNTLRKLEITVANQINDVLSLKRARKDTSPVVVIDFGGMYGISMLRLAAHFKGVVSKDGVADVISAGEVAFVVTNLAFMPEDGLKTVGKGYNDLTSDERALIDEHRHLVHYILSDARELKSHSIPIPGRGEMPLYGNVDIMHEDFALGHSYINDTDLPMVAGSLSPYGMLFLGSTGQLAARDTQHESSKRAAYSIGKRNMLSTGIRRVNTSFKHPHYEVYANPLAPRNSLSIAQNKEDAPL